MSWQRRKRAFLRRLLRLIVKAEAFHRARRLQPRIRARSWNSYGPALPAMTGGELAFAAFGAGAGIALGVALGSVTSLFLGTAAGCFAGFGVGRFLYPSPQGDFVVRAEEELEGFTPAELRVYRHELQIRELLGGHEEPVRDVLRARAWMLRRIKEMYPEKWKQLRDLPLRDLEAWVDAARAHSEYRQRWLQYELDPGLRIHYPAMADVTEGDTAAMIRALNLAEQALEGRSVTKYSDAVSRFVEAFETAERRNVREVRHERMEMTVNESCHGQPPANEPRTAKE